jgi:hypothetical protein
MHRYFFDRSYEYVTRKRNVSITIMFFMQIRDPFCVNKQALLWKIHERMFLRIQFKKDATLIKTPGYSGLAHPAMYKSQ